MLGACCVRRRRPSDVCAQRPPCSQQVVSTMSLLETFPGHPPGEAGTPEGSNRSVQRSSWFLDNRQTGDWILKAEHRHLCPLCPEGDPPPPPQAHQPRELGQPLGSLTWSRTSRDSKAVISSSEPYVCVGHPNPPGQPHPGG